MSCDRKIVVKMVGLMKLRLSSEFLGVRVDNRIIEASAFEKHSRSDSLQVRNAHARLQSAWFHGP